MFAAISLSGTALSAQKVKTDKTPEQIAEKRVSKMDEQLSLSTEQEKQMKDIFIKYMGERKAVKEASVEKMKEQHKAMSADMQKVLTIEQWTKWQQLREEHKGHAKADSGKRMAQMQKELNLTDKQAADLKALTAAHRDNVQKIKSNTSYSDDVRTQALKDERADFKKKMESILSKEQMKKLKEMGKEHKSKKEKK